MIPELKEALYVYLTSGANPFITLLGVGNLKHKKVLNDKAYPYTVFNQKNKERSIDSGDKFIEAEVDFITIDGNDDDVKESSISSDNIDSIVDALDTMLDLKQNSITINNYHFVLIKQKRIVDLPTDSNNVHRAKSTYIVRLQKSRS